MFEPVESWWSPRGTSKKDHDRTFPLEGTVEVESITDTMARFAIAPTGIHVQAISTEPLGHPHYSLHQNHYAAPTTPGTIIGSLDFSCRDQLGASVSSYVDDTWTTTSHPTGLELKVTQPGTTVPRYPAMTVRADGRVAFGGGRASASNSLVSVGVYRKGIFEMPKVERYEDLVAETTEPFVNGGIVYVKDLDRVLISQGGSWHAISTTPVAPLVPKRQMGQPRRDGQATIFGPRSMYRP